MTQHQKIIEYMRKNGSITPMEAIIYIGCTKLATRIGEISRGGTQIEKEMVYSTNRDGEPIRFMKYRLAV